MFTTSVVALIAALLLASSAQAQRGKKCCAEAGTISVTGAGRRSFPTSIAVVRLGVEFSAPTAAAVQAQVASRSQALTTYLTLQSVDKLMTTGVSLFAQRNFRVTPAVITGYRGTNTVSFEVPISRAGAILDGAVRNGASQISGISFKATPLVTQRARNQALQDATRAAYREARVVAGALGVLLGKPKTVSITDSFLPQPRQSMQRRALAGSAASVAPTSVIVGGESTATARVQIVFYQG